MLVFDIETGARPDDELRALCPPFDASSVKGVVTGPFDPASVKGVVTGEFDPSTVKTGATKDQEKREAKTAAAKAKHEAAVAEGQRLLAEAQAAHELAVASNDTVIAQAAAEHWAGFIGRAALSPVTGRVLAIGYLNQATGATGIQGIGGDVTEESLLNSFWAKYRECRQAKRSMLGFNILGFDVPFIVRRSWLLGVDVPDSLFDATGRYLDRTFVDLMQRWQCGAYRDSIKLNDLAQFFGVGGKPDGICGADFARLWFEARETAIEYLKNDLKITSGCAAKMGFI